MKNKFFKEENSLNNFSSLPFIAFPIAICGLVEIQSTRKTTSSFRFNIINKTILNYIHFVSLISICIVPYIILFVKCFLIKKELN